MEQDDAFLPIPGLGHGDVAVVESLLEKKDHWSFVVKAHALRCARRFGTGKAA